MTFGKQSITSLHKGSNTPMKSGGVIAATRLIFVVGNHDEENLRRPEAAVYSLGIETGAMGLRSQFPVGGRAQPKRDTQWPAFNWATASLHAEPGAYGCIGLRKEVTGKGALGYHAPDSLIPFLQPTTVVDKWTAKWLTGASTDPIAGALETKMGILSSTLLDVVDSACKEVEHCGGGAKVAPILHEIRSKFRRLLAELEFGVRGELLAKHTSLFGHLFTEVGLNRLADLVAAFGPALNGAAQDRQVWCSSVDQLMFRGVKAPTEGIIPMITGPSLIVGAGARDTRKGFPATL